MLSWAKLAISGRFYFCPRKLIYFRILSSWIYIWREKCSTVLLNFPSPGKMCKDKGSLHFHVAFFIYGEAYVFSSFEYMHMQPHFNGQPWLFLTNCKILLPWQILGRWQLPRRGMCQQTQVCEGNEASEGTLPCRWALRSEDDAVVCPTMSWHGPRQSRKALILRPREV